jgi:hypothetical protein
MIRGLRVISDETHTAKIEDAYSTLFCSTDYYEVNLKK